MRRLRTSRKKRGKKEQTKQALQEYGRIIRSTFEGIDRKKRQEAAKRLKTVK